jgi:hypothetical protein
MEAIKKELTEEQRRQNRMALGERMLASKRQMQKDMKAAYKNDPYIKSIVENLKKKDAKSLVIIEEFKMIIEGYSNK